MQQLGDHFTAEGLLAAAPDVGRATVFRTLRLLQDVGTLCQVILDDGTVEYRLTSGGHHHHIVCSECGAVNDFASCDMQELLDELSLRTGFDIESHRSRSMGAALSAGTTSAAGPSSFGVAARRLSPATSVARAH